MSYLLIQPIISPDCFEDLHYRDISTENSNKIYESLPILRLLILLRTV